MTYTSRPSSKGSALGVRLACTCLLLLTRASPAADCAASPPAEQTLLDAETGFARAAQVSVRQAFLALLADDAWVLDPGPVPARARYAARPETPGRLEWYPSMAVVARSGDLGVTSGPYTYTREATQTSGHFLTVWRRIDCRWRVAFDGNTVRGGPAQETPLTQAAPPDAGRPVGLPGDVAGAFQTVAGREGLGAALRTYARNEGFLLLLDGQPPLTLGPAEQQLRNRVTKGVWREAVSGASDDTSLSYAVGALEAGAYAEVWQYDARTANWGLRLLLLTQP